jgi:hypothetical protein
MQRLFRFVEAKLSTLKSFLIVTFFVYSVILLPLTVVVYNGQFIADDLNLLHAAQVNPFPVFSDWTHSHFGFYRPLVILSFFLNFRSCGYSPFSFYLVNFFLHLVATLSVALLGRKLFLRSEMPYSNVGSFLLGLIFLISPQNLQNILWISGRTDLLCGLFVFISLLMFIEYIESSKMYFLALFVLAQVGAYMSKETAIITNLYAIVIIVVYTPKDEKVTVSKILVPPVVLTAIYLLFRAIILKGNTFIQLGDLSFGIMKTFKFVVYGVWAMAIPIDLLDVISFLEESRFVAVVVVASVIIALAMILKQIVYNRGNNLEISLVIYMLDYPQMRLIYLHYPFILIGFAYLMLGGKQRRFSLLASVLILSCLMLFGVFNVISRSVKINDYVRELYRVLPDKAEYNSQKQYILLCGLGRIGQSYGVPNLQYMASLKLRGDLVERNRSFSTICYYETHSFDPLVRTGDFQYVNPSTIEVKASQRGSVLVPFASKKFNFDDSLSAGMSKNVRIIPIEMNRLRQGGANSCEIVFNDGNFWNNADVLIYDNNKFIRMPLESFISDLQGKRNR